MKRCAGGNRNRGFERLSDNRGGIGAGPQRYAKRSAHSCKCNPSSERKIAQMVRTGVYVFASLHRLGTGGIVVLIREIFLKRLATNRLMLARLGPHGMHVIPRSIQFTSLPQDSGTQPEHLGGDGEKNMSI